MKIASHCIKDPNIYQEIDDNSLARYDSLIDMFQKFKEDNIFNDSLYLNEALLYNAVYSYFIDLQRTKCFHNIPFADQHKKAAYTMKWITKVKPIQIKHTVDIDKIDEECMQANELFAFIAGISFLDVDLNKLPDHFINNILYILQYRDVECLVLSSKMYLIERSFK
ncbi:MAG: hypothetical protein HF982_15825 [Desulfobacteraceae bacterium]|nr:hypothetical protein [Desulfobacteraceae bacterium]MBC2721024.1 hypothetical protein [Desulfobacteraceae bacterium]